MEVQEKDRQPAGGRLTESRVEMTVEGARDETEESREVQTVEGAGVRQARDNSHEGSPWWSGRKEDPWWSKG